ncbi:MAG: hypothetical protein ABIP91_02315 [Sphingomicrobium sp.]
MKAAFLFIALSSCTTVAAAPPSSMAAIGQTATVGPFAVRPIAVVEDSRCPADVQCVWAGRLRLLTEFDHNGGAETLRREMVLGTPVPLPEGSVTLSEARPAPIAGQRIEPRAYRFTFTFQGTR